MIVALLIYTQELPSGAGLLVPKGVVSLRYSRQADVLAELYTLPKVVDVIGLLVSGASVSRLH